ncbi:MAG TPA: hypothetical protein VGJ87_18640 [Roseiflexaceae bacterium]|jgi:hypothetical protein
MNHQQRRTARATFLTELQAWRLWREAGAVAGLALSDGRHVHKLHPPIRDRIVATCQVDRQLPSRQLQAMLEATFAVTISIRYLN